jgi:hypothetical protein
VPDILPGTGYTVVTIASSFWIIENMLLIHISSGMLTFTTVDSDEIKISALFSSRARRHLRRTAKAIIRERLMAEMDEGATPPPAYTEAVEEASSKGGLLDADKTPGCIS